MMHSVHKLRYLVADDHVVHILRGLWFTLSSVWLRLQVAGNFRSIVWLSS